MVDLALGYRMGSIGVRLSDRWASPVEGPDLLCPIDVAYRPRERALYVLDFGEFELGRGGEVCARAGTGVLCQVPFDPDGRTLNPRPMKRS